MTKLNAADMMVIVDTLNHSLRIRNYDGGFTTETREQTMYTVIDIMSNMNADLKVEESEGEGE